MLNKYYLELLSLKHTVFSGQVAIRLPPQIVYFHMSALLRLRPLPSAAVLSASSDAFSGALRNFGRIVVVQKWNSEFVTGEYSVLFSPIGLQIVVCENVTCASLRRCC